LRIVVRCFVSGKSHFFRLSYKRGLLLLDNFVESFRYSSVTGTSFCDDEIEEDDACNDDGETPKKPEKDVLGHLQLL
jgi:hypothetical protein